MENIGKPESYWIKSTKKTDYPTLENDIKADAAVIGGGIAGLTCAYLLKKQGLNVVLIESNSIINGTSGHTTAKITSQHSLIYDRLLKKTGRDNTVLYAKANEEAIDFIEQTVKEKNIECNFKRTPSYVITQQDKYINKIKKETVAALLAGLNAEYLTKIPLPINIKAAVKFNNQAQFHPKRYLLALAKEIEGDDSFIFEHTKAVNIVRGNVNRIITDKEHCIYAKHIIVATHFPFYDKPGLYFTRLYPERSYIVAFKINSTFGEGMYITAEDNGFSLRSQNFGKDEIVLLAGESHRAGCGTNFNSHYTALINKAEKLFEVKEILYRWSAQDYATPDGVPYAGRLSPIMPDVYVATGFDKWGMSNGTAAAMIISDIIIKGGSVYEDVYNPCRMVNSFSTVFKFIIKNAITFFELIFKRFRFLSKTENIKNGEAKIIKYKNNKVGAYRDGEGNLHMVKTVCTHLKCRLNFNDAEKTWDCPCHGSRFDIDGNIIECPATLPLLKHKNIL